MADDGIDDSVHLTTLSEETELMSDEMVEFLRSNPVAYAGHRLIANYVQVDDYDGDTNENNEVPFLNYWFFAIALFGYWLLRRILHLVGVSNAPSGFDGHLFVMHSARHDKRHTLTAVGQQLIDQGQDVLLLCSPEAQSYQTNWEEQGFSTTSFVALLGAIPLRGWLSVIRTTIRSVRGLRNQDPDAFGTARKTIVFNFIFLEAVKTQALVETTDCPTIHTYSPMGYVMAATEFDRVFGYQHGLLHGYESESDYQEYKRGYPFFAPINYLTWGAQWHDKLQYSVPSDAKLFATGSPWHEFLAQHEIETEIDEKYDVLFLSSTGRQTTEGEQAFEEFVDRLISVCEQHGWELNIKLHPKETGDWYAERDWSEYVIDSSVGIKKALLVSKVAITTGSSTLIESILLDTPICVWFGSKSALEENQDMDLINHINLETIGSTIESAMGMNSEDYNTSSILSCDEATDRIVKTVTDSEI
jgi:hypothetical protein